MSMPAYDGVLEPQRIYTEANARNMEGRLMEQDEAGWSNPDERIVTYD